MTRVKVIFCFLFLLLTIAVEAQLSSDAELVEGNVSYVTANSVYLKFPNTSHINKGDTLFIRQKGKLTAALIVNNKSSLSCVCSPLQGFVFHEGDVVNSINTKPEITTVKEIVTIDTTQLFVPTVKAVTDTTEKISSQQSIRGRLSLSSYTNCTNANQDIGQRMRYTFSFSGQHLGSSKFSLEMYMSFVHRVEEWQEVKDNVFSALKIYNFSAKYDITAATRIWLGRRINYKLSSLGAIDGLQFEHAFRSLTLGVVAGSRPDYTDYSINLSLFQFGAYLSHEYQGGKGKMENTLAFMNQSNDWKTDRRFMYFQHTNTLLKNLFCMGTAEIDLYSLVDSVPTTTFDFSNLYLLLRYKILPNLSVSTSYSARKNIIYYETYKDFLERLLESNTLQGFRLMIHYRPAKYLSLGAKAGYRYRTDDPNPSKDLYGHISYSMIPGINSSVTVSVAWLETSYLSGWVYSIGLSKDIVAGRLFGSLNYRYVSYDYSTLDLPSIQNIVEVNLNWRIYKKLSLGAYYEGAFENTYHFNRAYINITQRF